VLYIAQIMTKSSTTEEVPGTESDLKEVPSIAQIEKWMERDLSMCHSFLSALISDKDLRRQMATFLQGRMSNAVNRPDPSQLKMPL